MPSQKSLCHDESLGLWYTSRPQEMPFLHSWASTCEGGAGTLVSREDYAGKGTTCQCESEPLKVTVRGQLRLHPLFPDAFILAWEHDTIFQQLIYCESCILLKSVSRASLVAQWLRICLPMQGTTRSSPDLGRSHMPQSNWAREPQILSLRVWSLCSATREAGIVRGPCTVMKSGPRLPQLEKALAQKRRPNTAKNK